MSTGPAHLWYQISVTSLGGSDSRFAELIFVSSQAFPLAIMKLMCPHLFDKMICTISGSIAYDVPQVAPVRHGLLSMEKQIKYIIFIFIAPAHSPRVPLLDTSPAEGVVAALVSVPQYLLRFSLAILDLCCTCTCTQRACCHQ